VSLLAMISEQAFHIVERRIMSIGEKCMDAPVERWSQGCNVIAPNLMARLASRFTRPLNLPAVNPARRARGLTWRLLALTLFVGASASTEKPAASGHYYEGKRIEVVIPTSVGGGTDRFARLMADGLHKFVPGNPTVVPRQMTGGGGILAVNWFANRAPKDGTVLFAGTGQGTLRQMLRQKSVRANASHFDELIALPTVRTVTLAAGKGIQSREEVGKLSNGPPIHTALVDPISGITFVMQAAMLDIPLKIIPGYEGGRDRDLAIFRGEIDIIQQPAASFASSTRPLLERGAVVLWSDGLVAPDGSIIRDPGMPDFPTFGEVYESATGKPPSGELWEIYRALLPLISNASKVLMLPADAPPQARADLVAGLTAMAADPEFAARIRKESEGHDPLLGDDLDRVLKESRELPPEKLEFLRKYISSRFEVEFYP